MNYLTDREVAAMFGIGFEQVQARCRDKQWPHLRIGRRYAFKPEHVEQIADLCEHRPVTAPAQTWGRKTRSAS